MARDDADFADYLAARWPAIEATLLRVGCPERQVLPVAVRGLAAAQRSWRRVRRDDVDVCVLGDVLREARSRLGPLPGVPAVLRDVAGLRPDQIERVLDRQARPVRRRRLTTSWPTSPLAGPPTVGAVRAESRAARARQARAWAAALGLGVAATALAVVVTPTEQAPTPVAWYADGVLHGDGYDLEVGRIRQVLRLDEGTAYVDDRGGIHQVVDGRTREVAWSAPDVAVLASSDGTRLAWVEGTPEIGGRVVVYDVARRRVVATLDLGTQMALSRAPFAQLRLVALDEATLHLAVAGKDLRWEVGASDVEADGVGLVDVAGATEVRMREGSIEVIGPFFGRSHLIDGVAAVLSPDGRFVLSTVSSGAQDDVAGRPHRVRLHDAMSGSRIPSGLTRDTLVLDAAFGPGPSVTYLVVPTRDPASGPDVEVEPLVVVRTCELPEATCHDLVPVESGPGVPLLAQ